MALFALNIIHLRLIVFMIAFVRGHFVVKNPGACGGGCRMVWGMTCK